VPSPDDTLIAVLQQSSLLIFTYTGALLRSIALSTTAVSKCRFIRWSRLCDKTQLVSKTYEDGQSDWQCNRILLADDDSIRVYDVNNTNWSAVIERPSGTSGGITDIAFGYTSNEVLVFSDFGIKVIIWSLTTSRGVEIKDPKYTAQCYSFRPRTGHLAILTRPATQDILMLLNPDNHTLVKSIEMPTVDAQEVACSSDGRWVAVRDLASCGSRVSFYTADGHPFKTYLGAETSGEVDLGVKCMEWNPCTGSVALGSYNDNVTILGKDKVTKSGIILAIC